MNPIPSLLALGILIGATIAFAIVLAQAWPDAPGATDTPTANPYALPQTPTEYYWFYRAAPEDQSLLTTLKEARHIH